MGMIQVLYVSSGAGRISLDDVSRILAVARRNNGKSGVTGMLLFCDGNFLQLLEGSAAAVDQTLERIARDRRHKNMTVLLRAPISSRSFVDWSMGFEPVDSGHPPAVGAAFEISRNAIKGHLADAGSWQVLRMMETFYNINTRAHLHLADS